MASKVSWKDDWLRRVQVVETASRDGIGFYKAYRKIKKQEEPAFIQSYMASIEQSTEQKGKKSQELDKGLENVIVALFAVVSVAVIAVVVVAQIALLLASLVAVVIGAFAIGSAFKSGGGSGE